MPAPTVQMGLGGTWGAVAQSHFPDAHTVTSMRTFRQFISVWETVLSVSISAPSSGANSWLKRSAIFPEGGRVLAVNADVASDLPGGGVSVQLDGVGEYGLFQTFDAAGIQPCSIDIVVKVNALPSVGDTPGLIGTGGNEFALLYKNDGRVYGRYNGVDVVDAAMSTGAVHHVALTRSGASTDAITLYLDGVAVDTASVSRVSFTLPVWDIGISAAPPDYLNGVVYGAGVYGGVMTAPMAAASWAALSWTDVTQDTVGEAGLAFERGIRDDRPTNRVASTGTLACSMNNLASNSGGVTGYYAPGHASCRAGFGKGTPVRVLSGSDVVWTGRIRSVAPDPGKTSGRSKVVATDYMDIAAVSLMENASVMESVRGNEVFAHVVGLIPVSPNGQNRYEGNEVYTVALDNTRDETVSALTEFHRLAMSELGYIYQKRAGSLVYENRNTRNTVSPSPTITLNDTMHGLDVAEISSTSINRVQVTTHPRVIDASATTVLFALANPLELAAGETKTIIGPFRAATATGITTRVGGLEMVDPVATTDYEMNDLADGTGIDLTAGLGVVANYGPNGVRLELTNNARVVAYVTKMQCRGKGVYDFRTVVVKAQNDAAIAADGVNAMNVDMVYQEDPNVGQAMADVLLAGYGDLNGTRVRRVAMLPDAAGMPAGLWTADISTRVAVSETVTGATGEYYINGVKHEYKNGTLPRITWWLAPAEPVSFWLLGTSGSSELDQTTMLGAA